jgi:hypothetical protein
MRNGPVMRVDWFQIIVDLSRKGLTTRSMADAIHVPQPTLLGWKQGAEPKHVEGERLAKLWMDMTQRPREDLPHCALLSGLHPPGQP